MSKLSIFCIVTALDRAKQIVDYLRTAHFSNKDLSVLLLDESSVGGIADGALGWVDGIGNLAIPGVGHFITAGQIIAALSGVGGIAGWLVGLGVPEFEARQYESRIKSGNILLAVHAEDAEGIALAKSIFAQNYGENICIIGAASAKKHLALELAPVPTAFTHG